jgi:uncharacterized protein Yka (UPF0111/DUF47 family)
MAADRAVNGAVVSESTEDRLSGTTKVDVLDELGEPTLLLPSLVNRGLDANDRAKYLLSLLQAARSRADEPGQPVSSLRDERLASGVFDADLDEVVKRSRRVGADSYIIWQAGRIHADVVTAVVEMLAPLAAGGGAYPVAAGYRSRLDALLAVAPDLSDDRVPGEYIDRITSARRERGDSLHLLVMDAHRALNRLQAQIATTAIDGAAAYGLAEADRGLVAAFMAGLHETAALKFDHPGLATTATRVGSRLLIQNDLGTTNAHVVVVAVENTTVTVTYTDVHRRRLRFFESLLDRFPVQWSDAEARRGPKLGEHHVATGRYEAVDLAALEAYLRHVGSRLVFVLDWNRARKRLNALLRTDDAIAVLRWAADNNVGHMAFLALGGERLIYDAVELAGKMPARYGEPLREVLGQDAIVAVTRFALRAAAEGMLAGKSQWLIRDELRVEVLHHVHASHRRLLDAGAEHASLVVETARALRAALLRLGTQEGSDFLRRASTRAARWEHQADEILIGRRRAADRIEGSRAITTLIATADDAIDALEETIYLLTLLPREGIGVVRPTLDSLAAITVMAAREYLKAVELARHVVDGSAPEDLEDFLVAVDRVATLEHEADMADRKARAALVIEAPDFRSLYVADCVSRGAEDATDALLRSALGLRDLILSLLSAP